MWDAGCAAEHRHGRPKINFSNPTKAMPADVIAVAPTQRLQQLKKERRTRHAIVWIVHDVKSGTVLMAQKLQHVAEFANNHLSEARREQVTVQG